jgi:hypothetical protein
MQLNDRQYQLQLIKRFYCMSECVSAMTTVSSYCWDMKSRAGLAVYVGLQLCFLPYTWWRKPIRRPKRCVLKKLSQRKIIKRNLISHEACRRCCQFWAKCTRLLVFCNLSSVLPALSRGPQGAASAAVCSSLSLHSRDVRCVRGRNLVSGHPARSYRVHRDGRHSTAFRQLALRDVITWCCTLNW